MRVLEHRSAVLSATLSTRVLKTEAADSLMPSLTILQEEEGDPHVLYESAATLEIAEEGASEI